MTITLSKREAEAVLRSDGFSNGATSNRLRGTLGKIWASGGADYDVMVVPVEVV